MKDLKKVISHYNNMPIQVKAAVWFVLISTIQKSFSLITVPVFTRIMTIEQYGIYSVYLSWLAIVKVFLTLNQESGILSNVLGKESDEDKKNSMVVSCCSLSFFLTSICLTVALILRPYFSYLSFSLPYETTILMLLGLYSYPVITYWSFQQRFFYRYKALIWAVSLDCFFCTLLGIILVNNANLDVQANNRIISTIIIESSIALILYIGYIKKTRKLIIVQKWAEIVKFQMPLIPHFLAMTVLLSSDKIMIQHMVGTEEAAIYSVASNATQILILFKACIVDAVRPWIYKKLNNGNSGAIRGAVLTLSCALIVIMVIFSLVAPEIIKVLSPREYHEAINVVPIVAMCSLLTFLYNVFCVVETYYEQTVQIMISSIGAAILNVLLNIYFIPMFGIIGAAYTTVFSYLFLTIFHYCTIAKLKRNKIIEDNTFNIIYIGILILTGFCVCHAILLLYESIVLRYILVAVIFSATISCLKSDRISRIMQFFNGL